MASGTEPPNLAEILAGYHPPANVFDEFFDSKRTIRPVWNRFIERLQEHQATGLGDRWQYANRILRENGVTVSSYSGDRTTLRPWEIDLLPLLFEEAQWAPIQQGVAQRARLIEAVAKDLYGPKTLLAKGIVPANLLYRHPDFQRAYYDLPRSHSPLLLYGCELARSSAGNWFVMADRTTAPAGIGYTVENRIVISKTLPHVLHSSQVHRLAPFFQQMQESIKRMVPRRRGNPTVVVLTSGPEHPYYFEDLFLARYLGFILIEVEDLTVRKNRVCIKTLERLLPVDVILWRLTERNCDPLELVGNSPDGIAGLLQAIRHKQVVVTNGMEYGLLDSPIFMPFLAKMCEELLEEELLIPSIATWWCGQPEALKYVLANLDSLVIKPAFHQSGGDEYIINELPTQEHDALRKRLEEEPELYVAQEKIARSSAPCWTHDQIQVGHLALRTYAVKTKQGFETMKGGLVRVAKSAAPMPLTISAGEFSKDVWICSEKPVPAVSLLTKLNAPTRLRRANNQLPSRKADNLFWLGRYLERLEFSGRQIRKVTERLMSESADQPVDDVVPAITSLAAQGLIQETYKVPDAAPPRDELEEIWPVLIANNDKQNRFSRLIDEIQRLASRVRDRLSDDLWRAIRSMSEQRSADVGRVAAMSISEVFEEMNDLLLHISAINGQVHDGLIHGPTRRFMLIGKHLERSSQLSIMLRHFLDQHDDTQVLPLVTLLDIGNCLLTYRARYRANINLLPAVDLMVTDRGNPRAMIYQFRELSRQIRELPRQKREPRLSPVRDLIRRTIFELQSILPDTSKPVTWADYQPALKKFLQGSAARTKAISAELTQSYFIIAGETHQIDQIPLQDRL